MRQQGSFTRPRSATSKTKEHILQSVERELEEHDSGSLTLERVSSCANVSKQTIYYHFKSLGNLIALAQLKRVLRNPERQRPLLELMTNLDEDVDSDKFQEIALATLRAASYSMDFGELTDALGAIRNSTKSTCSFTKSNEEHFNRWVRAIRSAQIRSQIRDDLPAEFLALILVAISLGQSFVPASAFGEGMEYLARLSLRLVSFQPSGNQSDRPGTNARTSIDTDATPFDLTSAGTADP